ncbi:hypothetical protein [Brevundimonas subvibrioides]|uniref:hypothetical protein n=1 Tax=Brevundimonas subvibrioides TaxID=74313 RepID=UPI0022B5E20A|nr:hypothetical protein [Brevundimonas subvibrioides]
MASRLQTFPGLALSLSVTAIAMALGGLAQAQVVNQAGTGRVIVRCEGPTANCLDPAGGSLRNATEDAPADEPATGDTAVDQPTPSPPHASAVSADPATADAEHPADDSSEDGHDDSPGSES